MTAPTAPTPTSAVFYTDGSSKPTNPGHIGWSVHGYTITAETAKRGAGHPKVVPGLTGYADKSSGTACVQVGNYYDYIGWHCVPSTNNAAEVYGCAQALAYASTFTSLKHVTVYSDSMYAVKGANSHVHDWVANNWLKRDGSEVKNQDAWKELLASIEALRANSTKVKIEWVKGHGSNFGNIKADHLAGIAGTMAMSASERACLVTESTPDGYWKSASERHPLIGLRGWLFSVCPAEDNPTVTEGEYYLCNQVKSDEFIGSRDVDGAYGYVRLTEPDKLLELVRTRHTSHAREFNTLALARIDRIYDKAVCASLESHGDVVLRHKGKYDNNLYFINESLMTQPAKAEKQESKAMPITEELYPPLLAMRAVTVVSELHAFVDVFALAASKKEAPAPEGCEVFDITGVYYGPCPKSAKPHKLFKKDLGVSEQSLTLRKDVFGSTVDFQIIFGIHVLARNSLKRLEGSDVQVWLVVRKTGEYSVRYYTVVRSDQNWSAWSGAHTNLVIFKDKIG